MAGADAWRPTEAEAVHEARRVLARLVGRSHVLMPVRADVFAVVDLGRKSRRAALTTKGPFVRAWLSAELIEPCAMPAVAAEAGGAVFVLSDVGKAFIARVRADANPFATQHRMLVPLKGAPPRSGPAFNAAESPLGWLRTRKDRGGRPYLTDPEFLAGERLRRDFTIALMTPKSSASWPLERVDCSRRCDFSPTYDTERAIRARGRFWKAIDAVGQELAPVLIGVCCHLERIETIEARLELPTRSAKAVLKFALASLARHYGLLPGDTRSIIRSRSLGALPAE